jgi:hypothetical protein
VYGNFGSFWIRTRRKQSAGSISVRTSNVNITGLKRKIRINVNIGHNMPKPRTICWYRVMSRPFNWGNYLYDTTKKIHIMLCSTESFYTVYIDIKLNILLFMPLDGLSLVCLAMRIGVCICLHIWNIFISWAEMYNGQQWSTFLSENHIFPLPLRNYIFHFPLRNKSRRMPIRAGNIPICLICFYLDILYL